MQKHIPLLKTLLDIGLNENEAQVYIAALSLGPTTVLKIARTSEIKRTTVYSTIEALKQKGLLRIDVRGLKQLFVAEDPQKLQTILQERQVKLTQKLPELSALYKLQGDESTLRYYEGLESIKNLYLDLIRDIAPHEDYLVIADQHLWYELDKEFFQNFIEKRAKKPIRIRLLLTETSIAQHFKKYEKNFNTHIKILPQNTKLTTNMVVTPQRVIFHQLTKPVSAIVIENKSIIQMQQELFNLLWNANT